jgi:hypothetical protein
LKGEAVSPWAEATFTIRPQPFARIPGSAAAAVWNAELRLMARIASHFAVGNSSTGATCWMPALFTSMSQEPAWATSARHSSPLDMSARM